MIKITLILWLLTILSYVILRCLVNSLTLDEKFLMKYTDYYPKRFVITTWVFILFGAASVISTIIIIAKW